MRCTSRGSTLPRTLALAGAATATPTVAESTSAMGATTLAIPRPNPAVAAGIIATVADSMSATGATSPTYVGPARRAAARLERYVTPAVIRNVLGSPGMLAACRFRSVQSAPRAICGHWAGRESFVSRHMHDRTDANVKLLQHLSISHDDTRFCLAFRCRRSSTRRRRQ